MILLLACILIPPAPVGGLLALVLADRLIISVLPSLL